MSLVGFEPAVSAGERPQTYALDRAATGTGVIIHINRVNPLQFSATYFRRQERRIHFVL